jgi:hypothetical protein
MAVYLSPVGNSQVLDSNGVPLVGGYWECFLAGTTTPRTTYTSSDGLTAQPAQITLDASGRTANPIWITGGVPVKFRLSNAAAEVLLTLDNISGINDPTAATTTSEWLVYSGTPTYINATSFSLPGDQTGTFQPGRRVKTANTAGVRYSTIVTSVYGSVTTITVVNDSGTLDSGLSEVSYGILGASNASAPRYPTFSAYLAASGGSAGNNTASTVLYDTVSWDTRGNFASNVFTATVDGYYQFNAAIQLSASAPGFMTIYKYTAATTTLAEYKRGAWNTNTGASSNFAVSGLVRMLAGDYVQFRVYHSYGSSLTPQGGSAVTWCDGHFVRGQ